jgi:hypothetical protein
MKPKWSTRMVNVHHVTVYIDVLWYILIPLTIYHNIANIVGIGGKNYDF